ncbi:MAG: DUF4389 domain-containing protein [Actinomyces sp.]|nr:MAG: DUF4389 domain-containing protein [Actinomyces sp.]
MKVRQLTDRRGAVMRAPAGRLPRVPPGRIRRTRRQSFARVSMVGPVPGPTGPTLVGRAEPRGIALTTPAPPPPPPPSGSATPPTPAPGPLFVVDTPYEVARWRPLLNWLLVVPHLVIGYGLGYAVNAVGLVYWVIVVVTGRPQAGLYHFLAMAERYSLRSGAYLFGLTSTYPPFELTSGPADDGHHPGIGLHLPAAPEQVPRWAALNVVFAIPHYVVWFVFSIGAAVVAVIGWFAVVILGRWPTGLRDYLVRVTDYGMRIWVYVFMVDTRYPRFGL